MCMAVMIRLPPTAIQMGVSDLRDYEKRQQIRRRMKVVGKGGLEEQVVQLRFRPSHDDTGRVPSSQYPRPEGDESGQVIRPARHEPVEHTSPKASIDAFLTGHVNSQSQSLASVGSQELSVTELGGEEHGYVSVGLEHSPENAHYGDDTHRAYSPSKDDFYYGGFIETPTQSAAEDPIQSLFGMSQVIPSTLLNVSSSKRCFHTWKTTTP